jgi:hypothetical protein
MECASRFIRSEKNSMFMRKQKPAEGGVALNAVIDRGSFQVSLNASISNPRSKTTSIVYRGAVFLTLNGDHRQQFVDASKVSGLQGCFDYFLRNIDQANHRSGALPVLRGNTTSDNAMDARRFLGNDNIARLTAALERSRRAKLRALEIEPSYAM